LQQNHNKTHNAVEHKNRVGPLSKPGIDFFSGIPLTTTHSTLLGQR